MRHRTGRAERLSPSTRARKVTPPRNAIGDAVLLEERDDGLLLRSKGDDRLSWEDTFRDTAREREDWSDLDVAVGDGLAK